jgi:hypothetical protein
VSEVKIYVEGGGNTEELRARCREGITKLLKNSGFAGRLPRIVACGSRNEAFDDFKTAHEQGKLAYVALLVDSEDPIADIEQTWDHLKTRDDWPQPQNAQNDQVLLMTTCMETWIIADRTALSKLYKNCLQTSRLPSTSDLEQRHRHAIQDSLVAATRSCSNAYAKNKRSFEALASVDPNVLRNLLPSFARMIRILKGKL